MSIQLASTDVIQVLLDAAPATNQLPVNVSYVDQGGSGNNLPSITSGTTPVTIVGSPASGVERLVSHISIPNADTATRTVTVNLVRSSVASRLCKITLQAGYALYYDGKWMVLDPNGNFLCDVTVTGGTLTSNQGAPAAIANAWPVEVTDGTNVLGTSAHPLRTDPTGTTTQPVSVTNFPGVQVVNLTQVASSTLTSPSNYGTAPTGTVIGVNAFITNIPPVSQSGSWTVTSNQGTSPWTIQGDSASGTSNAGNPVKIGGAFNTTQPTVTTGQTVDAQMTARGAQIVATGIDTFNVTINAAIAAGSNTIGNVNAIQSGTWTVQQGGAPWSQNVSQWGGSSTTLGQKTSANSIPVVISSDQSTINIQGTAIALAGSTVTGTSVQTLFGAARTILKSLTIASVGPVLAAGTVILTIQDNASSTLFQLTLPTASTTATTPYIMLDAQELNVVPAGGMPLKLSLSSNLTSGAFFISGSAF